MVRTGRNQPCGCGSGRKTKRCCGVVTGPSPDQQARAWLDSQAREWAPLLVDYTDADLDALRADVSGLPARDASLRLSLPRLVSPALERLRGAVADHNEDALAAAAPAVLAELDTPERRACLGRAVLALHDDGHRVECDVAAYALVDLAEPGHPTLLVAALLHSLEVCTGSVPTPSGLVLAGR